VRILSAGRIRHFCCHVVARMRVVDKRVQGFWLGARGGGRKSVVTNGGVGVTWFGAFFDVGLLIL
jgi:hypothetical protein